MVLPTTTKKIHETKTSLDKDLEKLEPLYVTSSNGKWKSLCRKVWLFLGKLNIELPHDSIQTQFHS